MSGIKGNQLDTNAATDLGALSASNIMPQAEAENGTATVARAITAQRIAQAITAQASTSSGSATITLPTGGSIAARVGSATGVPAGWSLVDGTDGAVDAALSGDANDLVIIHTGNVGFPVVNILEDFGGILFQHSLTWKTTAGDIVHNLGGTQIRINDLQTKPSPAGLTVIIQIVFP